MPLPVADLAAKRRLGELQAVHGDPGAGAVMANAGVIAAASAGGAALGALFALRPLLILAVAGAGVAVILAALSVKVMVAGARRCYLYSNGFVSCRARRLRGVSWPEVAAIVGGRVVGDTTIDYYVQLNDGSEIHLQFYYLPFGGVRRQWVSFQAEFERVIAAVGVARPVLTESGDVLLSSDLDDRRTHGTHGTRG